MEYQKQIKFKKKIVSDSFVLLVDTQGYEF